MSKFWKDIIGFEDKYRISDTGIVYSVVNNRTLSCQDNGRGYKLIILCKIHFYIHRLVALAFIPNPNNFPQVNHINGNKADNSVSNLEWCNNSHNQKHAHRTGLKKSLGLFGQRNGRFTDGMRCIINEVKICPECKSEFSGKVAESVFCSKVCSNKRNARILNKRMSTLRSERFANNYGR